MMQAATMGPPPTPMGYSLKVKLCEADGATENQKRWFRVSASPDVTIREFCTEASRIHERNYGSPITIKKCTDDEGFDVMQDDIVGQLFPNMSIIRIVQASTRSTVRDSLPPSSALRFTTSSMIGQKRVREDWNGVANDFWGNSQKRQRVIMDPDHPLPSRETDPRNGTMSQRNLERLESPFIPDSQQDSVLIHEDEPDDMFREVRVGSPAIRETPPPTPLPEMRKSPFRNYRLTNSTFKPTTSALHNQSSHARRQPLSPVQEATPQSPPTLPNGTQPDTTTNHAQQTTNRESSSSTRAVSPLLGEPELPVHAVPAEPRKLSEPKRPDTNTGIPQSTTPRDERSVYDDFGTDSEDTTVRSRGSIKTKKSPRAGLPDIEKVAKFSTPPSNSKRALQPLDAISTPGTLPLTPNSRKIEREAQLQQNKQVEKDKEARKAAAAAAEERLRAEKERLSKEEERKLEERRSDALRKEKEEFEAQQARKKESDRLRKEIEEEDRANAAKIKPPKHTEKKESTRASSKSAEPQERKSSTPRATPSTVILPPRSSTPHIPTGRKSALKKIPSSQLAPSSSPEASFKDVSLEAQLPLPSKKSPRRVSFNMNDTTTPSKPEAIKPSTLNKARQESTPKSTSTEIAG
ncbi:hypothetical protein CJF31_00003043 [Rutstroemia sp. NJR-2017a BVV2]|nr:hypothetical protein CJF31_00001835 [Rutstroemia sp. NJR-2017a BVV2]PQE18395.1 hypothetical protein CJF31_00003043 [Rutstroemia sp. NJR-2017a BVV2]